MVFASRQDAGSRLGARLRELDLKVDRVVGLLRGGVVIAKAVADVLERPLDVLAVRKIGHPRHREWAAGALAEKDVIVLDETNPENDPDFRAGLDEVIAEERDRLQRYIAMWHPAIAGRFAGERILLVDDGLATGATAEAAVLSARRQQARTIIVAAPVASITAVKKLAGVADDVLVLHADPAFDAVGRYYAEFDEVSDQQIMDLLKGAKAPVS